MYIYIDYIYIFIDIWCCCARRVYVDSAVMHSARVQDSPAANCQGLYNWRSRASCGFSESGPLVLEVLVHTVAINEPGQLLPVARIMVGNARPYPSARSPQHAWRQPKLP